MPCTRRALCFSILTRFMPVSAAEQDDSSLENKRSVLILTYHRFASAVLDSMTVHTRNFSSHLDVLADLGCSPVNLNDWVRYCRGELSALPPRAVVLTADDGHRSQYDVMGPLLAKRGWTASLFIYPSVISNASYAMTWLQLRELVAAGFPIQSHTYWHPNFLRERRQRTQEDFLRFATWQLVQSKASLESRVGQPVSLLAWPFGLSDAGLRSLAAQAGYRAAFGLGNRAATRVDNLYDQPRWLVTDDVSALHLKSLVMRTFGR